VDECEDIFCFGAMFAAGQSPSRHAADNCCEAATRNYGREAEYFLGHHGLCP
jgi:hypothetical protein